MNPSQKRDTVQYDVVVVGAGPAGLAAAIRLKQLDENLNVCVLEKGSEVGAHILSGAVFDPIALTELLPDWRERGAPLDCAVREDRLWFLGKQRQFNLPVPPGFHNQGNYIISLGRLCRWLAEQAEGLGVEIYAGFAATEVLYDAQGAVMGVATGDMGIGRNGEATANHQPGIELHARQTLFAEGARGSLSKQVIARFALDRDACPPTYGLGIKEIWEVPPQQHQESLAVHTLGWPLDSRTYGGGFIYHAAQNRIAIGLIVGLDYRNPYLSPFEEMQRFKTHPAVRPMLQNGRRIAYGARVISEGGLQSLPQLCFDGGALIGDAAGFLNMSRLKGSHTAIKSGMLAAEAVCEALSRQSVRAETYPHAFAQSWLYRELHAARNIRPAFRCGLYLGSAYAALEQYLLKGRAPWTFRHHRSDARSLNKAADSRPIAYPPADGTLTFNRSDSVFLANLAHEENQPVHLVLGNPLLATEVNAPEYASPETRYCPAGVYEIIEQEGKKQLHINAANCIHCKTCDIKDPTGNITWTCPEGASGPNYGAM
ncbi:electron transfer flavoprotein-ubiquinone oxidoreductase [Conchiformibius kuhniae]|uniref:Electron transfer flavoprotein-ubiquinone oxidoreductase n=1 Tax=Conchiformibius kuhniae TaxID=211502 RepID=A0ABD8B7A6_9NEIS|nr:electron transfer flavoprotein-ubiquinone oxidoreductase [Conchiformibius kuhniae]